MANSQFYGELENITTADNKYFTFWLNNQLFAIPIGNVVQIVGLPELTPIPEAPHYIKGIMNVRGTLMPTIDLRARFALPETDHDERTSVIVINMGEKQISVIVDGVNEVANIPEEEMTEDQEALGEYISEYITSISVHGKHIILHLDMEKLFGNDAAQYM